MVEAEPTISTKTTIGLRGTTVEVGKLHDILGQFPRDSKVTIQYSPGDPRDPREYATASLVVTPAKALLF